MNEGLTLLGGLGLGAGLMYFFDPEAGPRRRAQFRDQIAAALGQTNKGADNALDEPYQGPQGLEAEIRSWLEADGGSENRGAGGINFLAENWTPATRLLAGSIGGALMANCLARGAPIAVLLGTVGFGLFMRGYTNQSMSQLLTAFPGRWALPGTAGETSYRDSAGDECGGG